MDEFDGQSVEPVRKAQCGGGCRIDDEPTPRVGRGPVSSGKNPSVASPYHALADAS